MSTTQTFPAGIAVGIAKQGRRFGHAVFAVAAMLVVIAVAIVTLAVRNTGSVPASPATHTPATWNTPSCPLHGVC